MTYAEAKVAYEEAISHYDFAEKNFYKLFENKEYPPFDVFRKHLKPYSQKVHEAYCALIPLIDDYELSDFPDYGDYFTMKEFRDACEAGAFIDYDGSGELCIGNKRTDIDISPSHILSGADLSKFDGVMWYNK